MVAHRSPKPLVWVRILVLLPQYKRAIPERNFMYSSFFKSYIIISVILILISVFTIKYSETNSEILEIFDSNNFYWPLPGNRTITSYFGKRNSPTARSIIISLWN